VTDRPPGSDGGIVRLTRSPASRHPLLDLQRTAGNAAVTELVAQRSAQTKEQARTQVDAHVEPKACFVWHQGSKQGWTPIPGTGCAHWISHQLGISRGLRCDAGLSTRVRDVIAGMDPVPKSGVAVGDIWRSTEVASHAGIVRAVLPDGAGEVAHDSTRRKGVVTERMTTGRFFRP
jgi:hypothetical protein